MNYDDALRRAKELHDAGNALTKAQMEIVFPELAESEDERIRKELIKEFEAKLHKCFEWKKGIPNRRVLDWLEKQKEQKDPFDDEQFRKGYETGYEDAARVNFKRNERFEECLAKCDPKVRKEVSDNIDKMLTTKFKKGDWVVYDGILGRGILQVADVKDGRYTFVDNESTLLAEDSDPFLRPLTPADLKEQKPVEIKIDNPNIQKVDPDVKVTTSDSSASGKELLYVSNKSYDIGFRDGVASVKPTEWSEDIINRGIKEVGLTQHQIDWLKRNVDCPPKQEWSEEDEKMFCNLIGIMEGKTGVIPGGWKKYVDWMKNRYKYAFPMPRWKPSEEQMEALEKAVTYFKTKWTGAKVKEQLALESLYEQLKKL